MAGFRRAIQVETRHAEDASKDAPITPKWRYESNTIRSGGDNLATASAIRADRTSGTTGGGEFFDSMAVLTFDDPPDPLTGASRQLNA